MSFVVVDLPFVSIYVDDLLIGASSPEEMVKHLGIVFECLNKYNLKIQLSKSKIFTNKLKILGVIFSKQGRTIDPEKIAAIKNFPMPTTLKGLQSFLGMLAYISSFILHFSSALYLAFHCLKDQKTKQFVLTKEAEECINAVKNHLCERTMLYNPDFKKPFYLSTDASNVGMGAFLYQITVVKRTQKI